MKIIQVVNSLDCGGLEKTAIHLSKALKDNGHDVLIVCLSRIGDFYSEVKELGINVVSLDHDQGFSFKTCFKLVKVIWRHEAQVVHAHNIGALVYAVIASKLAFRKIKVIVTRHGRESLRCLPIIWALTDAIVTISLDAKEQLVNSNHIKNERIKVIYNGIPVKDSGCDKPIIRIDNCFIIGHVARLTKIKDQETLLFAFQKLLNEKNLAGFKKVRLVIAGDGEDMDNLIQLSKKLNIYEHIEFLGFSTDVSALMQSFDIFVLPSLSEGISLTLLEAMAASKALIATNVGGTPEVVIDGQTGILIPARNPAALMEAIFKIMQNPDMAKKLGENGRSRLESVFGLETMVRSYEKIYV